MYMRTIPTILIPALAILAYSTPIVLAVPTHGSAPQNAGRPYPNYLAARQVKNADYGSSNSTTTTPKAQPAQANSSPNSTPGNTKRQESDPPKPVSNAVTLAQVRGEREESDSRFIQRHDDIYGKESEATKALD